MIYEDKEQNLKTGKKLWNTHWESAQKHLSGRMRQVFNLRIKTVWKFTSMLMALCLSLPDEASSSAQDEEIHLKRCHNNAQWIFIVILLPCKKQNI